MFGVGETRARGAEPDVGEYREVRSPGHGGSVECSNHRHRMHRDGSVHPVRGFPQPGFVDPVELGEIESCAEDVSATGQDHHAGIGQGLEGVGEVESHRVRQSILLVRTVQGDDGDAVVVELGGVHIDERTAHAASMGGVRVGAPR